VKANIFKEFREFASVLNFFQRRFGMSVNLTTRSLGEASPVTAQRIINTYLKSSETDYGITVMPLLQRAEGDVVKEVFAWAMRVFSSRLAVPILRFRVEAIDTSALKRVSVSSCFPDEAVQLAIREIDRRGGEPEKLQRVYSFSLIEAFLSS
jgi:hypothetical protein